MDTVTVQYVVTYEIPVGEVTSLIAQGQLERMIQRRVRNTLGRYDATVERKTKDWEIKAQLRK